MDQEKETKRQAEKKCAQNLLKSCRIWYTIDRVIF